VDKELIIRSGASDVDFALLKNGRLVELHKEEDTNRLSVGDIMLAKIHKPIQGLNAAFVNVGYEKDAFLHYHDLGPQLSSLLKFIKEVSSGKIKDYSLKDFKLEPDINKNGAISEVLKAGQPFPTLPALTDLNDKEVKYEILCSLYWQAKRCLFA